MSQEHVYEGTPEQLVKQLRKLPIAQKYKTTVIPEDPEAIVRQKQMIAFGMFPQLQALTEVDFKEAEWLEEDIEL